MLFLFPRVTSQVTAGRHLATAAKVKYPGLAKIGPLSKKGGFV